MKDKHDDLVNEVARKIGVNILLFQQIEMGLKLILPFICTPNSGEKDVNVVRVQREVTNSKTLGALIRSFIESVDYDPDYFSIHLKKIVDERNKLVHCFGGSKGLSILDTEEGCRDCLTLLEAQRKEAFSFYEHLRLLILSLVWLFQANYGESSSEVNLLYKELRKTVIGEVEWVNLVDPSDTAWANTKIVKLLRLAELSSEKLDGMTFLSRAGKFIKSQDPECLPKNYGIKTLKGVLRVSGLFEIIENQDGSILYRSKVLH